MNIQLADYQMGLDNQVMFGGNATMQDVDNLNKALSALEITGRETTNLTTASGAPLKVESLEKTLKVLQHTAKDVVFWNRIPKAAAFNTVEEYNQLTSYGGGDGGFFQEGETPFNLDSTYVRRAQLVKYLGVQKSVTHQMTLVNTMIGDTIAREAQNGTLDIMRKIDRALYFGNANIVPEEFNGFLAQHAQNDIFASYNAYMNSASVLDLRGAPLSEAAIENGANTIVENYGSATTLFGSPRVLSDFVKNFYANKLIQPNTAALTDGIMGQRVNRFMSQFGEIELVHDLFFTNSGVKTTTSSPTNVNAPSAPTPDAGTPIAAVGVDALSKWSSDDAGTYFYAVTALNRFGESALAVLGGATAIVAGGAVDLTFALTPDLVGTNGFQIYRSNQGAASAAAATFYPLYKMSVSDLATGYDGAAAGSARDRDRFMPGCNQAFMVQENTEVINFKQLAPIMKMDLAITSPAFKFLVLMYGTPFLYAPLKMVRIINIGLAA